MLRAVRGPEYRSDNYGTRMEFCFLLVYFSEILVSLIVLGWFGLQQKTQLKVV